jgi:hypothetical protein
MAALGGALTPLLTPPRVQHAATARNREQRIGLDKRLMQHSATSGSECPRIVGPVAAVSFQLVALSDLVYMYRNLKSG